MKHDDRRAHPRVEFPVLVLYRGHAAGTFETAYGRDLSASGMRVGGAEAEVGAMLDLQLVERRGGHPPLDVLGEVIRSDPSGFSLRFIEIDDAQLEWLEAVIADRRNEHDVAETEDLIAVGFDEL